MKTASLERLNSAALEASSQSTETCGRRLFDQLDCQRVQNSRNRRIAMIDEADRRAYVRWRDR